MKSKELIKFLENGKAFLVKIVGIETPVVCYFAESLIDRETDEIHSLNLFEYSLPLNTPTEKHLGEYTIDQIEVINKIL